MIEQFAISKDGRSIRVDGLEIRQGEFGPEFRLLVRPGQDLAFVGAHHEEIMFALQGIDPDEMDTVSVCCERLLNAGYVKA